MSDGLLRFDPEVRHLRCTGRDAVRFLHAVTTQEIASLEPGQGAYAALVTDRGGPIADFYAFRSLAGDEVVLELPDALAESARAALERLIIADDVELAWSAGEAVGFAAAEPGAPAALDAPAAWPAAALRLRAPRLGLDSIVLRGEGVKRAGDRMPAARAIGAAEAAWRALAWGRPAALEFAEAKVLNELGILHAVSFAKGCFMGQEILQRVRTQGRLQRRLVGLAFAGIEGELWSGTHLFAPDAREPVGRLTRAALVPAPWGSGSVGLGFVRDGFDRPGAVLEVQASDAFAGSRATVTEPPFLTARALEPGRDLVLLAAA